MPRFRSLSPLLLVALCLTVAGPSRAADPAQKCQKATAKALSACIQGVSKAEVGCFKKTDAACAAGDSKRAKAIEKLEKTLAKDCLDDGLVEAAGYAPLDPAGMTDRLRAACEREVDDISERVFGSVAFATGERGVPVGLSDPKCQLAAGKEVGSGLSKMIKTAGKCVGKTCDSKKLDKAAANLVKIEEKIAKKVDKKCSDPAGLFGLDAAGLAAETSGRVATAAAGPCDPLDDGHCMMPFSNDYFTVTDASSPTGRRLNFSTDGMPRTATDIPVEPTKWGVVDGFSVGPMLVSFEQEIDLGLSATPPITDFAASLEPDVTYVLLDADTGEQQLLMVERDLSGPPVEQQALIGRVGRNLENSKRYLVAQRGLVDGAGTALPVNPVFAAYRDRTSTGQLPVEARRAHMETLLGELETHGVARADLHLAWDFTTQSVESTAQKLLTMRDDAFDNVLGAASPAFTVDSVEEPADPATNIFRVVDGTFQVPLYLTEGGIPGSELRLGADGQPTNEGDFFTARYRCVVPYAATTVGAAPAIPARLSLYGHGLLGTGNQTGSSHVRAFAREHNLVICGTDWTGFADEDEPTVFEVLADFSNFPRFIERQHQGVLNFQFLGRVMQHVDGFATDPAFQIEGESLLDPSGIFYDGNSQGGILGGVLAAVSSDIERFVLGVPGINYSTLLNRSVDFTDFGVILNLTYPSGLDRSILLAVAQIIWDQTDPSGHVRHTTSDTYANTPPKKLLYQVAFGDHQVAPFTAEIAARSNGTAIYTPILRDDLVVPEVDPYYDIPAIPSYPYDGSALVIWDSLNPPPPIGSTPPVPLMMGDPGYDELSDCAKDHGSDPHECPRRQPAARTQKSEFLKNDGAVVDVCGAMACLAPLE